MIDEYKKGRIAKQRKAPGLFILGRRQRHAQPGG
jgi:hypothetical protein